MKIERLIEEVKDLNIKKYSLYNANVIYFLCDSNDEIVYIGKTQSISARVIDHKDRFKVNSVYYTTCNPSNVDRMEKLFIKKIKPKHNIHYNNAIPDDTTINIGLYMACVHKKMKMHEIASLAGIQSPRFSKILNGKLTPKPEEKRKLSKILKVSQKELFCQTVISY